MEIVISIILAFGLAFGQHGISHNQVDDPPPCHGSGCGVGGGGGGAF